jgi:hypothetical protein
MKTKPKLTTTPAPTAARELSSFDRRIGVGTLVGFAGESTAWDGTGVGTLVGSSVGDNVGDDVGASVGLAVGGVADGAEVGREGRGGGGGAMFATV